MTPSTTQLSKLLERLHEQRSTDEYAEDFPSLPARPGKLPTELPTLKNRLSQPITPQLQARFAFAGRWLHPSPGIEWLTPSEMRKTLCDSKVQKQIATRREYWEGSILAELPPERITLFGIDRQEQAEIYLAWKKPGAEPAVYWYTDQHEHRFANLKKYIEFLLG